MDNNIKNMSDAEQKAYAKGYYQAFQDFNTPMPVIADRWNPTECPRCNVTFSDYEPCNDRHYKRAINLARCPVCGQMLDWSKVSD